LIQLNLVLLEQHLDAAGEPGDHLVLAAMHGRHADADARALDTGEPPLAGALGNLERVGVLEQRLGGDAAPDQAGAAERLLTLDDGHLEAQLGGANRSHVATRSRADHHHVVLVGQDPLLIRAMRSAD
jgi:hypothetical protein